MISQNPKREFTIAFDIPAIKKAVFEIVNKEPHNYILVNDDTVLNQIRIHEKGQLMDVGYHIDFAYKKVSETETTVLVEVSRKIGAVDTPQEVHNANYILKEITDKFSSYLSGKVDASGKAQIPKNDGCMLVVFGLVAAASALLLF
jgi:hypothetical protein